MALSRTLLFVAIAAVPFGIACNGIIGLSDFQYGECPGARCGDAGFPDDVNNPETIAPDAAPPIDAGPGSAPVSWAQWKMPNYDGGPPVAPDYTDNGTTVTDKVTGLVWQKSVRVGSFGYADAVKQCEQLTTDGSKWRLPKRIELVTLIDYSRGDKDTVATIGSVFTSFPTSSVWTSSEIRSLNGADPTKFWTADFRLGVVEPRSVGSQLNVLCVKAVQ